LGPQRGPKTQKFGLDPNPLLPPALPPNPRRFLPPAFPQPHQRKVWNTRVPLGTPFKPPWALFPPKPSVAPPSPSPVSKIKTPRRTYQSCKQANIAQPKVPGPHMWPDTAQCLSSALPIHRYRSPRGDAFLEVLRDIA